MYRTCLAIGTMLLFTLAVSPGPLSAQYVGGFEWSYVGDYQQGTVPGSSQGNPAPDAMGNPTWTYATTSGGSHLGTTDPWYEHARNPMVWDDSYLGFGDFWVRADDVSPFIAVNTFQHDIHVGPLDYAPMVVWRNPTGNDIVVDIDDQLTVAWINWAGGAIPQVDVDVVVIHHDVSATGFVTLLSQTLGTPSQGSSTVIPVDIDRLELGVGDRIFLSVRARDIVDASQIQMISSSFTLRMVECQQDLGFGGPGTATLEICGDDLTQATSEAQLALGSAAPSSPIVFVYGLSFNPTNVKGGTLVPVPWQALTFGAMTDGAGNFAATVAGGNVSPVSVYLQALIQNGSTWEFSNALSVDIGQ